MHLPVYFPFRKQGWMVLGKVQCNTLVDDPGEPVVVCMLWISCSYFKSAPVSSVRFLPEISLPINIAISETVWFYPLIVTGFIPKKLYFRILAVWCLESFSLNSVSARSVTSKSTPPQECPRGVTKQAKMVGTTEQSNPYPLSHQYDSWKRARTLN